MSEYLIRKATKADIEFIVESIIEAEKSGTNILSYSTLFGLSEDEVKELLSQALAEEVEDCDLALSGFLVADYKNKPVASLNAWIEAANGMASVNIKGNILSYFLSEAALKKANHLRHIYSSISVDYKPGSFWIGPAYVSPDHRGSLLLVKLCQEQIRMNPNAKEVYCQVFANNQASIQNFKLMKFSLERTLTSNDNQIEKLLPSSTKYIMFKEIGIRN